MQTGEGVVLNAAHVQRRHGRDVSARFVLAEGAKLARVETHVDVEGEGADVELNGVYLAGAGRHADLTSVITQVGGRDDAPARSRAWRARAGAACFRARSSSRRGAQKTDARQYHHGMLLEDGAEIFAKPELMIHADDVQCAHGNTAGGLDETRALLPALARRAGSRSARAC